MTGSTVRGISPARAVALALVVLAVLGLAYLRSAAGTDPVSVPEGAKAGDLILEPCTYDTENGSYPADCGTLVVAENREDPGSRLIALPVTRIRARSEHPGEPVFRLEGGPGITNMSFTNASRLADEHDVVLVGYRGVDGSVRLDCPEVVSVMKHSGDYLDELAISARVDGYQECAQRLQEDGVDLAGYTLPQRVDDLEAARKALGYERVDLVSESAGTRTAMIYSWRYPESIHRSVMIAVNPPGHFLWDPQATDEQVRRYAALCAEDATCRERTDDLAATMSSTAADIPDRWGFLPIKDGNVRLASFWGMMESTSAAAPLSAPMTMDSWLSAAEGDPSGLWFQSLGAQLLFPQSQVWGDVASVARADAGAAERYFSAGQNRGALNLGSTGSEFIWGGGRLLDAWPAGASEDQYDRVQTSEVETLLVGGTLDFATPPGAATKELLPHLPNGHQVVLAELGHSTDFWAYQPQASSRLINTFLDSGTVDDSLYRPAEVDFTPEVTQTAIAKGILAVMVGFVALAALSLLLMARRVHTRGGIGRKTSAYLRSVHSLVLGLGGWFLGVMVAMTTLPGVALDDELLAAVSIGVPVGLGTYLAWVTRDRAVKARTTGLAAAAGGALAGAWLGFNATDGLLAVISTIVGAAAGANLMLLVLDIAWDRQPRGPVVGTATPEPVPDGWRTAGSARTVGS